MGHLGGAGHSVGFIPRARRSLVGFGTGRYVIAFMIQRASLWLPWEAGAAGDESGCWGRISCRWQSLDRPVRAPGCREVNEFYRCLGGGAQGLWQGRWPVGAEARSGDGQAPALVNAGAQRWKDRVEVGDIKSQERPCSSFRSPRSLGGCGKDTDFGSPACGWSTCHLHRQGREWCADSYR